MKKTIGEKIKEIRMQNNLTMDELAEELGYSSRSTINKIEKGINDISYEKLLLLLKKYEISMSEFIEDNDEFDDIIIKFLKKSNYRKIAKLYEEAKEFFWYA